MPTEEDSKNMARFGMRLEMSGADSDATVAEHTAMPGGRVAWELPRSCVANPVPFVTCRGRPS